MPADDLKGFNPLLNHARFHQLALLLASASLAATLSGCGTINANMSAAMGDYVPAWAGGLPADAPPRPGTAKYDEFMKERERLRQMPAADRPGADQQQQKTSQSQTSQSPQQAQAKATSSTLDPVH